MLIKATWIGLEWVPTPHTSNPKDPSMKLRSIFNYNNAMTALCFTMCVTFVLAGLDPKYLMGSVYLELGWRIGMCVLIWWNLYQHGWHSGYTKATSVWKPLADRAIKAMRGEYAVDDDVIDAEATPLADRTPRLSKPTYRA